MVAADAIFRGGLFLPNPQLRIAFGAIDWDLIVQGGFDITRDDVALLKANDERAVDFILHNGDSAKSHVQTLLKVLRNVTSDSKAQYFAASRLEDVLDQNISKCAGYFTSDSGTLDTAPFTRAISAGDDLVVESCAISEALLIVELRANPTELLDWVCDQLRGGRGSSRTVRVAVQALAILLRSVSSREQLASRGGVGHLNKILRMQGGGSNTSLLYELCFCLWNISLEPDLRPEFGLAGAVPTLVEQVSAAPRDKVVRVALATLRNLTEGEVDGFSSEMISCGLPKTLQNMQSRHWSDPDIAEEVKALHTLLQHNYRELSSFERYSQEVMSGHLKWGVCHKEKFWREHARETEQEEFFLIKQLIELVRSEDETVKAIACYDIGEFVRFYPSGRSIAKHLGAKDVVMDLVESENPEVRKHALQCVSKILVTNWAYIR